MFQTFDPVSDKSFARRHTPLLRAVLKDAQLDGVLIPHDDEYQNEYLPDFAERLMWVSGFSGSAGFGIVLTDKAAVFSDGRYTLQLRDQVDTEYFSLHQTPEDDPAAWLVENASAGARIGYDPMVFTEASLRPFKAACARAGITLEELSVNPVDTAWTDQPAQPCAEVTPHATELAGKSSLEKRTDLATDMAKRGVHATLIAAPTSIAWLFNVRGGDVHASPLPLGRAILHRDGRADLFLNPDKSSDALRQHLGNDVSLRPETDLADALQSLGQDGASVAIDPALVPLAFVNQLSKAGAKISRSVDPCALPRATKTAAELSGTRTAHQRDGVAVTRFLHWFSQQRPSADLNEIAVAQKLESFRAESGALKDVSFDTISGAGAHGAICHYRVTTETNAPLTDGSLFLIDSGGQYVDGTTDITRTMPVGTPTAEMKRHYTLVLQGHIALATARFPKGVSGHQLDCLARKPLWDAGLDYDHGTGHGVGSYLGVHEGPQNISKKPISQPLMPGMICSNEPGYYQAGEYGIRIENLIIVTPPTAIPGGDREMMAFETITMAPLEPTLIDASMLTATEREWVNTYHQWVFDSLSDDLDAETAEWLRGQTAPL